MSELHDDDIVCLMTARNPAEAHIVEQALQEEGIACRVVGDYLDAGLGDIPGLQAEIWVHRDDVERSKSALAELKDSAEDEDEDSGDESTEAAEKAP